MSTLDDAIREAIQAKISDCQVEVSGDGRHFNIQVTAAAFEGLRTLQRHQMVLGALKDLMAGDDAPVHAVDTLTTKTP